MTAHDESCLRKFVAPELIFGVGARNLAVRYSLNLDAKKIFVVSDPIVQEAGWTHDVTNQLKDANLPFVLYLDVSPNPPDNQVMKGAELFLSKNCNIIIAVGGGSVMDCAKGIGIVAAENRHILEFEGVDKVSQPIPPLICIPTTGGSSADVSQFAIITDHEEKTKIAIISKAIVPDIALIDPLTLTTMPGPLTVATGMDALAHAFEAYVSNANSPLTDLLAIESARLLFDHLPLTLEDPSNVAERTQVMLGSLNAGLAFSNASLGAIHAMAHAVGGLLDTPHGDCNSILLPHIVDYNFDTTPDRYRALAKAIHLNVQDMDDQRLKTAIISKIVHFQEVLHAPQHLHEYKMERASIPKLARIAMKDACMATNPRRPTAVEIEQIYEKAY